MSLKSSLSNLYSSLETSHSHPAIIPFPSSHWKYIEDSGVKTIFPIVPDNKPSSVQTVNIIDCIHYYIKHEYSTRAKLQGYWKYPKRAVFCIEGFYDVSDAKLVYEKLRDAASNHDGTILRHRMYSKSGK